MRDHEIFPMGDWSCFATDLTLKPVEVWAVIDAELDYDSDGYSISFKLLEIDVIDKETGGLTKFKIKEDLKLIFHEEQIKQIYNQAYDYCVLRFEQDNKPLCFS